MVRATVGSDLRSHDPLAVDLDRIVDTIETRTLTHQELGRYLDYCSEILSLASKVSAIYAERFDDPVVLQAVDEVETPTTGLSRKIWQKTVILGEPTQPVPAPAPIR